MICPGACFECAWETCFSAVGGEFCTCLLGLFGQ